MVGVEPEIDVADRSVEAAVVGHREGHSAHDAPLDPKRRTDQPGVVFVAIDNDGEVGRARGVGSAFEESGVIGEEAVVGIDLGCHRPTGEQYALNDAICRPLHSYNRAVADEDAVVVSADRGAGVGRSVGNVGV